MPRHLILSLIFCFAGSAPSAAAGPPERSVACASLFSPAQRLLEVAARGASLPLKKIESLYGFLIARNKLQDFSFTEFEAALKKFEVDADLLPTEGNFAEEAAYWEAKLEKLAPRGGKGSLRTALADPDWAIRYRAYRSIRGEKGEIFAYFRSFLQFDPTVRGALDPTSVSASKLERFLNDVYLMNHFEWGANLRDLLSPNHARKLDEKLRLAAQIQIDREGLESYFISRGLFKDPSKIERIQTFMRSKSWAASVAVLTTLFMRRLPGALPSIDFLSRIREYSPRLYRDGISPHWELLRGNLRGDQIDSATYEAFRKAWYLAGVTVAGYLAYEQIDKVIADEKSSLDVLTKVLETGVAAESQEIERRSALTPGERAFEAWTEQYRYEHDGADPDTTSDGYHSARRLYLER